MKEFWDSRYSSKEYTYGKTANGFFRENLDSLKPGSILLPGEGEGRNAVYAAKTGWTVTAVDYSGEGRKKALKLASEEKVSIRYIHSDICSWAAPEQEFDAVALIFVHLPREQTAVFFRKMIKSLKPGGRFFGQLYSREQLAYGTGGPRNPDLLYSTEDIAGYLKGTNILLLNQHIKKITEGDMHTGDSSVIDFLAVKQQI